VYGRKCINRTCNRGGFPKSELKRASGREAPEKPHNPWNGCDYTLEKGDRAFHVVDPNHRADHLRRLEREGIDVSDAEAKGQLEVRRWQEAYIKDDHFDQHRMIGTIKEALDPAKKQPGKMTRLVANMEWALEDLPGVHDIVEYETRLNLVLPEYHDPVVCTYDLSRFDASVVVDIMRTHPIVIIGGILQENPFYVPPDEMLRELKERAAEAA
jgi:hypothetical protein